MPRGVETERHIAVDMPCREIEEDRKRIGAHDLRDGLEDGATHTRVVGAVGELSDNQSADMTEDAAKVEVAHHAVDMIVAFADVFEKEHRRFGTGSDEFAEAEGSALQSVEDAEVPSDEPARALAVALEGVRRERIAHGAALQGTTQCLHGGQVVGKSGKGFAHRGVQRGAAGLAQEGVRRRDVGEADQQGCVSRRNTDVLNDALKPVAAAAAENDVDAGVGKRVVEIGETPRIFRRETPDTPTRVGRDADTIPPRQQAQGGTIDERRVDGPGRRDDTDMPHSAQNYDFFFKYQKIVVSLRPLCESSDYSYYC